MAMPPNPQVVPLVGPGGFVTREWLRYLQGLITAASAGDLQALTDAVAGLNSQFASLSADVADLADDVSSVEQDDDLSPVGGDDSALRALLADVQQLPPAIGFPFGDDQAPPFVGFTRPEEHHCECAGVRAELDALRARVAALEQGYQL